MSCVSSAFLWMIRTSWILGIVLLVVGWGEWYPASLLDSRGYVINMASGFTAACFGVPLAFFILQRVLREREEAARLNGLLDRTRRVANLMGSVLRDKCSSGFNTVDMCDTLDAQLFYIRAELNTFLRPMSEGGEVALNIDNDIFIHGKSAAQVSERIWDAIDSNDYEDYETVEVLLGHLSSSANATLLQEGLRPVPRGYLTSLQGYIEWATQSINDDGDLPFDALERVGDWHTEWPDVRRFIASRATDGIITGRQIPEVVGLLQEMLTDVDRARDIAMQIRAAVQSSIGVEGHLESVETLTLDRVSR